MHGKNVERRQKDNRISCVSAGNQVNCRVFQSICMRRLDMYTQNSFMRPRTVAVVADQYIEKKTMPLIISG